MLGRPEPPAAERATSCAAGCRSPVQPSITMPGIRSRGGSHAQVHHHRQHPCRARRPVRCDGRRALTATTRPRSRTALTLARTPASIGRPVLSHRAERAVRFGQPASLNPQHRGPDNDPRLARRAGAGGSRSLRAAVAGRIDHGEAGFGWPSPSATISPLGSRGRGTAVGGGLSLADARLTPSTGGPGTRSMAGRPARDRCSRPKLTDHPRLFRVHLGRRPSGPETPARRRSAPRCATACASSARPGALR